MSKLALSDSISASTSPRCTSSPSSFFHSRTVPSSIVSESLGMLTSGIRVLLHRRRLALAHHAERLAHDVVGGRDRRPLHLLVVGHRDLGPAQPADRRVQMIE